MTKDDPNPEPDEPDLGTKSEDVIAALAKTFVGSAAVAEAEQLEVSR